MKRLSLRVYKPACQNKVVGRSKSLRVILFTFSLITLSLLAFNWLLSDTITLKNGSTIEGTIIEDDGQTVTIAVEFGKISIDHSEIESIVKSEYKPELPDYEPVSPTLKESPLEKSPAAEGEPRQGREIESTKPVSSTPVTPTQTTPFQMSDEDKTLQQKEINALLRELMDEQVKEPWQTIPRLAEEAKKDIPYMLELLKEIKDPVLRRWVIYTLGRTEDEGILKSLRSELKHPEEIVRKAAVESLSHFKDPLLQSEFKKLLGEETSVDVRCALIRALTSWQDFSIIPDLINLLGDKNRSLRYVASQSLVKLYQQTKGKETSDFDVLAFLIEKLTFAKPLLKKEIVTIFGQIKDKRSLEVLMELLTDEDKEIRSLAAMALAGIADKKTIQFLIERLQEETDVWTRIQIMQIFQKTKNYDTIPILIETLKDPEKNVSFAASRALRTITKRSFGADYERWKKWWDKLLGK